MLNLLNHINKNKWQISRSIWIINKIVEQHFQFDENLMPITNKFGTREILKKIRIRKQKTDNLIENKNENSSTDWNNKF